MIVTEHYRIRSDGVVLNRTYSDEGKYIIQNETGFTYIEAIDVEGAPYTYSESTNDVESEIELSAEEALNIIVGGSV